MTEVSSVGGSLALRPMGPHGQRNFIVLCSNRLGRTKVRSGGNRKSSRRLGSTVLKKRSTRTSPVVCSALTWQALAQTLPLPDCRRAAVRATVQGTEAGLKTPWEWEPVTLYEAAESRSGTCPEIVGQPDRSIRNTGARHAQVAVADNATLFSHGA